MLTIVAFTVSSYRANQSFRDGMKEPVSRRASFAAVLPHGELPAGYRPLGGMRVPGVIQMALLADATPDQPPPARVRSAFFFVSMRNWFGRKDKLEEAYREGGQGIEQEEVEFEVREELARGSLEIAPAEVLYYARRGPLKITQKEFGFPEEEMTEATPGLATMMLIDCPDGLLRVGLWFVPDPQPETPSANADWSGTPADPAALRKFLSSFDLCQDG